MSAKGKNGFKDVNIDTVMNHIHNLYDIIKSKDSDIAKLQTEVYRIKKEKVYICFYIFVNIFFFIVNIRKCRIKIYLN